MNNIDQVRQAVKKANEYNEMSSFRKEQYAIALDEINELKQKNEHLKNELAISENLGRMQSFSATKLQEEVNSMKCCGNCLCYEEQNGGCEGEWDKDKRHLCQLWRQCNV